MKFKVGDIVLLTNSVKTPGAVNDWWLGHNPLGVGTVCGFTRDGFTYIKDRQGRKLACYEKELTYVGRADD